MSKPERGSLSVVKRALPNLAPANPTAELEAKVLADTSIGQPDVQPLDVQQPDVQTSVRPDAIRQSATRLVPRPGRRKEPVQMVTYRIPATLYDRLMRTADYNNLNMTDIVVEAIERHLPNFPQPA